MMKWICKLIGHEWLYDHSKPGSEYGSFHEYWTCARCGSVGRAVVTIPRSDAPPEIKAAAE